MRLFPGFCACAMYSAKPLAISTAIAKIRVLFMRTPLMRGAGAHSARRSFQRCHKISRPVYSAKSPDRVRVGPRANILPAFTCKRRSCSSALVISRHRRGVKNRHVQRKSPCPLSAKCGHRQQRHCIFAYPRFFGAAAPIDRINICMP